MNEPTDVFQKFGGRKFLLALIALASLLIMASLNPQALTAEIITGVLGVLATYSGSNSILTALFQKQSQSETIQPNQPEQENLAKSETNISATVDVPLLEARVQQLEQAMNSAIEILKVQGDTLNRLTIMQNQSNLNQRGMTDGQNKS